MLIYNYNSNPKINLYYGEIEDTEIWIRFYEHNDKLLYKEYIGNQKIEDKELYISRKRWQSELGIQNRIEVTSGEYYYQSAKMENNILYLDYKIQIGYFDIEIYQMEYYEKIREDEEYGTEYKMIYGNKRLLLDKYKVNFYNWEVYDNSIQNIARKNVNTGWEYLDYFIDFSVSENPKIHIYYGMIEVNRRILC